MKINRILISLVAASLLTATGSVYAEKAKTTSDYSKVRDESLKVEQLKGTVNEIEDMKVYSSTGEKVGEIEELLMDSQKRIVAAAVEIDNLMDLDDDEVVVDISKLTRKEDRIVANMTKEQLEKLPRWND